MPELNIVLVGTENSGNLGAVARLAKNFEVKSLIAVAPRCEINDIAFARAMHGKEYLENIILIERLSEARKFNDFMFGFTARRADDYNVLRTLIDVNKIGERLAPIKGRIGIVFGRESSGLTNEELRELDFLATIPLKSSYPVLNLSHAVAIALYQITRSVEQTIYQSYREVRGMELLQAYFEWDAIIDLLEFPKAKRFTMKRAMRNILGRAFISGREAHTLIGTFRRIRLMLEKNYPPKSEKK